MNTSIHLTNRQVEIAIERGRFMGFSFKTCSECGEECDTKLEIGATCTGHRNGIPVYDEGPIVVSECCGALVRDENGSEVVYDGD